MASTAPIGVFRFRARCLTAVKELLEIMPQEHIVYLAIRGCAYGSRTKRRILNMPPKTSHFLTENRVKMIVVACGTVSSLARNLKKPQGVPFIDVLHPTALAASAATRNKRVGVIGTSATIRSVLIAEPLQRSIRKSRSTTASAPYLFLW